jgi:hypothetical protein
MWLRLPLSALPSFSRLWAVKAMAQNTIVALLVVGCFVYALWTLGPKAPRKRLAAALLKLPLPLVLQKPLTTAAQQQGGCGGCGGCAGNGVAKKSQPKSAAYAAQTTKEIRGDCASAPLVFYPRAVPPGAPNPWA